jgi:hypothetical protein
MTNLPADVLTLGPALGIGLLVGLERERKKLRDGVSHGIAGLRTFALTALLGWALVSIRKHQEAQANATVVLLAVSMLPLVSVFNPGGEAAWHLWVPALGQITLMGRVLKGEPLAALDIGIPLLVSVAVAAVGVWFVTRSLRAAAIK